ncbi:MAG: GCN5-related N-acetyltransferase [Caulobacter sp.]|nr:GCN5-related N-acetyltransferase [Caulobacter sp.]
MKLRAAEPADAAALAAVHALAFARPWSAEDLARILAGTGAVALAVEDEAGVIRGFIACRLITDEAEILTLAVDPAARRAGLGRALVEAAVGLLAQAGATQLFLEVAVDNVAAVGLYEQAKFARAGLRKGYYAEPEGAKDALILRRALNT